MIKVNLIITASKKLGMANNKIIKILIIKININKKIIQIINIGKIIIIIMNKKLIMNGIMTQLGIIIMKQSKKVIISKNLKKRMRIVKINTFVIYNI